MKWRGRVPWSGLRISRSAAASTAGETGLDTVALLAGGAGKLLDEVDSSASYFPRRGQSSAGSGASIARRAAIRQSGKWHVPLAAQMTYAHLRYDVAPSGVATVALDEPDSRNALSDELLGELIAAFEDARDD